MMLFHIYVYEFEDHSAYIGLTRNLRVRHLGHLRGGPVFEHIKICHIYTHKILASNLTGQDAVQLEKIWTKHYSNTGWKLLNIYFGHGTSKSKKWSPEAKAAYNLRNDRHRPKPKLKGIPLSAERRKKISSALRGKKFSELRRQRVSEGQRGRIPWNKGKPLSVLHKARVSQTLLSRRNRTCERS
jgi:predicted GIY-YIG superfamily endonuclease